MNNAIYSFKIPSNLPVKTYGPGTEDRKLLKEALKKIQSEVIKISLIIVGKKIDFVKTFKKIGLLLVIMFFFFCTFSQTIEKNEVDEFTGAKIIETSWETLVYSMKFTAYCRIRIVNAAHYFEMRLQAFKYGIYSIPEEAKVIFKLEDGSIYTIESRDYVISSYGGGATGLVGSDANGSLCEYVNLEDMTFSGLLESQPTKVRIYFRDSYIENDIKPKHAKIIQDMIRLTIDK